MLVTRLFVIYAAVTAVASTRPNIIFVLVDDMGYGDVGAFNPEAKTSTPNLDSLAASGMMFTDAHAPWSSCVPSHYGLLTGRFPFRGPNMGDWNTRPLIDEGRWTIASVLQQNGYKTGMVGKWHLGFDYSDYNNLTGGPVDRGFDYYFGISRSLDQADYYYIENRSATQPPTGDVAASAGYGQNGWQGPFWRAGNIGSDFKHDEVLYTFRDKSLSFIEQQTADTSSPFFLYLALASPHTPWLPSEQFRGTSEIGEWGDWVAENDYVLGQVFQKVYDLGLREQTLIFFTSDNGPVWWPIDVDTTGHRATSIYRGMKFSEYEGGHRMPFIASWPGVIEQESSSSQIITTTDMLSTFAAIVGVALPDNMAEDSYSIWDALLDADLAEPVRPEGIIGQSDHIRYGDWKLIGSNQLYNLVDDPSEQNNVYNANTDIAAELAALRQKYHNDGRSTPTSRPAEEIIFGCMDSLYGEYDPDATVQPENACRTLGMEERRPVDYYQHLIRCNGNSIEVLFTGAYSITIRNLSGKALHLLTGSGPETHAVPVIPGSGIYILDISLGTGQTGNDGSASVPIRRTLSLFL
jgi:arylsulfatase A-like enzyme